MSKDRRTVWLKAAITAWRRVAAAPVLAAALVVTAVIGSTAAETGGVLTATERAAIVVLGPWPAPWQPDASSRVSGNADAAMLGRLLFFDARLSGEGTHACSSCHRPEKAWTDGRTTARGLSPGIRNTPSLMNVRYRRWLGWDGAADSLWAQSLRPILDRHEMGSSPEHVRDHIAANADLAAPYLRIFGRAAAGAPPEDVLVDAGKALAAFQETLVTPRTAFDDFRDAIANGDATAQMPNDALLGLRLFVGDGGCAGCHGGPALASEAFYALVAPGRAPASTVSDLGRFSGLERLSVSPFRSGGRHDDSPADAADRKRPPALVETDRGTFRVPSLRGVRSTAPYLHDGSAATLSDAIARHTLGAILTANDIAALVAFLESL